ncbi:metallophosphoesterase [Paenibacillus phocaensis]|uniref:metallophosphoesterase n=1 Tax=Paenibacillus phocaensis TaxID=1776378 RepID=UPI000839C090|nr:metallophosphoesterase [Paenibacillus phocaensis]
MNILFLHLSDIHLESKFSLNHFHLKKIIDAVRSHKPFESIFLILSGDVANSGKANEYDVAYKMVGRLISLIKDECDYHHKINILVVPGNHDVDMSDSPLRTSDLVELSRSGGYTKQIDVELQRQTHFFNFAKRNNLFLENKLYCQKLYKLDTNFTVEVNLLNSAIFSTLEEDKGLHYLPPDVIQSINNPTGADFVLTVMHHPTDWFLDPTMQELENVLYTKSSLIFYGHKHYQGASVVSNQHGGGALLHAGGCLSERRDWSNSEFLIGKLSVKGDGEKEHNYSLKNYKWNQQQRQYEVTFGNDYKLINKPSKERTLVMSSDYRLKLLNDIKQESSNDFTKYFVFPRIESAELSTGQSNEFLTDEEFVNEILVKKKVMIYGQYNTGKTTLLKWLFLSLSEKGYTPVFCGTENLKGNPRRILKNCFEDIYGENPSDFQRFQQIPTEKKVFIIDDVDLLVPDHFERLIEAVQNEFSYFIFSSKKNYNLDVIEQMKEFLKTSDSIFKYELTLFYADKRNELIEKSVACHITEPTLKNKIVRSISDTVNSQKRLIRLDPDFILKYVSYYCKNVGDAASRTTNIFSKVFEANLVNALSRFKTKISVEKAFMLLSAIAYNVHFQKQYPIPSEMIFRCIENYNQEYGTNVNVNEALDLFIKSQILTPLVDDENSYVFSNNSYIAFFVARHLNIQYHETGNDKDLQYIIKNACFGMNGDILLFLTLITDNVRILRFILEMANNFTESWIEFRLDNIPDFMKWSKDHKVELPAADATTQHQKSVIKDEKSALSEIEVLNIYDYSEEEAEEFGNKLIRAIQLLSIVARCLPIFEHLMRKEEKENFVKQIYELPNKIFHVWVTKIDEEAENYVNYFKYHSDKQYIKQKPAKTKDLVQGLQWIAMSFLLELYKVSMKQAVKEHTFNYIAIYPERCETNHLYELQKLFALEFEGSANDFVNAAIKMNDAAKEPILKVMIKRLVANAAIFKEMDYKETQRLNEAFFKNNPAYRTKSIISRQRYRKRRGE